MKFKKNWKRFWTLNRHHAEGFTLVELIVVIAIIAILAGASTVGYSAYVKKANIAADQALVSEVTNAVLLLNYSENLASKCSDGIIGYVVLTKDQADAQDMLDGTTNYMQQAMVNAFGSNWAKIATIVYNDWSTAMLKTAMGTSGAASVNNSTFANTIGSAELLADVQHCASSFAEYLVTVINGKGWSGSEAVSVIDGNFSAGSTAVADYLAANGYDSEEEIDANVLANATVFGLASTISSGDSAAIINKFHNGSYIFGASVGTDIAEVAHTYAALEALAGYLNDSTVNEYFGYLDNLDGSATDIVVLVNLVCSKISEYLMSSTCPAATQAKALEYYGVTNIGDVGKVSTSPAKTDGEAYVAIMTSVNDLSSNYGGSLSNNSLFASDMMSNDLDSYVSAASLAEALGDDSHGLLNKIYNSTDSAIVLVFSMKSGQLTWKCLPVDAMA